MGGRRARMSPADTPGTSGVLSSCTCRGSLGVRGPALLARLCPCFSGLFSLLCIRGEVDSGPVATLHAGYCFISRTDSFQWSFSRLDSVVSEPVNCLWAKSQSPPGSTELWREPCWQAWIAVFACGERRKFMGCSHERETSRP